MSDEDQERDSWDCWLNWRLNDNDEWNDSEWENEKEESLESRESEETERNRFIYTFRIFISVKLISTAATFIVAS